MRRKIGITVVSLIGLMFAWLGLALWSGYQLRQAMRTRDVASLQSRVDWPTLRANIKPRLVQAVREDGQASTGVTGLLKRALGETIADRGVEYLVTPENLSRLLAGREFVVRRTGQPAPTDAKGPGDPGEIEDPDDPMPPRRLRWAFFETPTRFRLEAVHPRLPGSRMVATLAFQGLGWKLVDVGVVPGR